MRRRLAWIGVILSGLYLLTAGPIPDPIPFIDEGVAFAVLLKCMAYLGYDMKKWLPSMVKSGKGARSRRPKDNSEVTIDV